MMSHTASKFKMGGWYTCALVGCNVKGNIQLDLALDCAFFEFISLAAALLVNMIVIMIIVIVLEHPGGKGG